MSTVCLVLKVFKVVRRWKCILNSILHQVCVCAWVKVSEKVTTAFQWSKWEFNKETFHRCIKLVLQCLLLLTSHPLSRKSDALYSYISFLRPLLLIFLFSPFSSLPITTSLPPDCFLSLFFFSLSLHLVFNYFSLSLPVWVFLFVCLFWLLLLYFCFFVSMF